jgi:hypothetical protein
MLADMQRRDQAEFERKLVLKKVVGPDVSLQNGDACRRRRQGCAASQPHHQRAFISRYIPLKVLVVLTLAGAPAILG